MTLFTLLLVLAWERLFKLGDRWQLDHLLTLLFRRLQHPSLWQTLWLTLAWTGLVAVILRLAGGWLFNLPLLLLWILLGVLCIGAGDIRRQYRAYLQAARQGDEQEMARQAAELALLHGLPQQESGEDAWLRTLQNALLWVNFRYYLAPLFWLLACGSWGAVTLAGYAFLRAYQAWLAKTASPVARAQSGVDRLLHWLDWLPVRLAGLTYALLGHGERALPAWVASWGDLYSPPYQVLTRLAQFSLVRETTLDRLQAPRTAVTLARRVTMVVLVVVALLTIYGTLL